MSLLKENLSWPWHGDHWFLELPWLRRQLKITINSHSISATIMYPNCPFKKESYRNEHLDWWYFETKFMTKLLRNKELQNSKFGKKIQNVGLEMGVTLSIHLELPYLMTLKNQINLSFLSFRVIITIYLKILTYHGDITYHT